MVLAPQLATWPSGLGKGLQSPVPGFDSLRRLYFVVRQVRETGTSKGFQNRTSCLVRVAVAVLRVPATALPRFALV